MNVCSLAYKDPHEMQGQKKLVLDKEEKEEKELWEFRKWWEMY